MSGTSLGQLLLALSVIAGACGHTLLKKFVVGIPDFRQEALANYIFRIETLGTAASALLLLILSFLAWLGALRHLELSFAYAMASASILVVALLASLFLGETLSSRAWIGLLLIVIGCILVTPAYAGAAR